MPTLHQSQNQNQSQDQNLLSLKLVREMTTVKPTQGFNMKLITKTCFQASLIASLFAAGSGHAQLGSFEASIAARSSLLQV